MDPVTLSLLGVAALSAAIALWNWGRTRSLDQQLEDAVRSGSGRRRNLWDVEEVTSFSFY